MKTYRGVSVRPFVVAVILTAGAAAAMPSRPARAQSTRPTGSELFVRNCASCHGVGGRGDGPVGSALRVRPADLTRYTVTNGGVFPAAKLHRIIDGRDVTAHGSYEMPVWGRAFRATEGGLGEDEVLVRIAEIVRYLESIQERPAQ